GYIGNAGTAPLTTSKRRLAWPEMAAGPSRLGGSTTTMMAGSTCSLSVTFNGILPPRFTAAPGSRAIGRTAIQNTTILFQTPFTGTWATAHFATFRSNRELRLTWARAWALPSVTSTSMDVWMSSWQMTRWRTSSSTTKATACFVRWVSRRVWPTIRTAWRFLPWERISVTLTMTAWRTSSFPLCPTTCFLSFAILAVVVTRLNESPILLRNVSEGTGNWIRLLLRGRKSNRDGIGALVEIDADSGKQWNHVTTCVGYGGSSEPAVHFGLGPANRVRKVKIRWPSGATQVLTDLGAGRLHEIVEPHNE